MRRSLFLNLVLSSGTFLLAEGLSGRRAPSFSLPDSAMKQYDILDYRGRWLLLNFLRTDRPSSAPLTVLLDGLKPALGARVAILSILMPPDNTVNAAKYAAATKTTTPLLFDSGQTAMWYFKATPQRPQFDAPHLFAINPQGMIVRDWNEFEVAKPEFITQLQALVARPEAGKK
jgi:peroxiredoxin